MRTVVSLLACAGLVIGMAHPGFGENSVVVESKSVAAGATGVTIPIRISNDESLNGIEVPLIIREVTPGSFITSLEMSFEERLTLGGMLSDVRYTKHFAEEDGNCQGGSGGFGTVTYTDGGPNPVTATPEGAEFVAVNLGSGPLDPGADYAGSLLLTVDVTTVPGTFEIDTSCTDPSNHLTFSGAITLTIVPSFTKGTITIQEPNNRVIVESKTVAMWASGVEVPIRVTNEDPVAALTVPLIIREVTPGAFITSMGMAYAERLASGGALQDVQTTNHYAEEDGTCGGGSGGFHTITYSDGGPNPVTASPEGAMFMALNFSGSDLEPGTDATGSLMLTLDINGTPGTFEIDTSCASLDNHLSMVDPYAYNLPMAFTKGIITIEAPRAPDWVQCYDGPAQGDDGAVSVEVDATGNIYVTGTSEGASEGQCVWQYWHGTVLTHGTVEARFMDWFVHFTAQDACTLTAGRFIDHSTDAGAFPLRMRVYGNNGPVQGGRMYPDTEVEGANLLGYVEVAEGDVQPWPDWTVVDLRGLGPLVFEPGEEFFISVGGLPTSTPFEYVHIGSDYGGTGHNRSGRWLGSGGLYYYTYNDESPDLGTDIEFKIEAELCYGEGTGDDFATIKYDADGNEQWVRRYNGAYNLDDQACALTLDALGNVYAMGRSQEDGAGSLTTIKYAPNGTEEFVCIFSGYPNMVTYGGDVAVDASGNIFMTGRSMDDLGRWDITTVKFDATGDSVWTQRYDGPSHGTDEGTVVVTDVSGNIYIGGWVTNGSFQDMVTIKYNPDGSLAWAREYGGAAGRGDEVTALAVDVTGNVYVTGPSVESGLLADYCTLKYDPSGTLLWDRHYGATSGDIPKALALDGEGNLFVTGYLSGDIGTVKYSSDGDLLANHQYNGPPTGGTYDQGLALALDPSGEVYVAGYVDGNAGEDNCVTLKYNSDLELQDAWFYDGPAGGEDHGVDLVVDNAGNIVVGGYCDNTPYGNDYFVLKYASDCACPHQCDYDDDSFLTSLDLGMLIDVLFAGSQEIQDPACPTSRGDFDNDGFPTSLDLGTLIDHLFAGGAPPTDPCSP